MKLMMPFYVLLACSVESRVLDGVIEDAFWNAANKARDGQKSCRKEQQKQELHHRRMIRKWTTTFRKDI